MIRRVPRLNHTEEQAAFVLVKVESSGSNPLDVKLIGTDQESVFSVTLQHQKISSLRVKKSPCDEKEWETILGSILLDFDLGEAHAAVINGVEAIAKVDEGESMTITIQKRIEGITQRLGAISLSNTEEEEVDIFEWCGSTITSKATLKDELRSRCSSLKEKDIHIEKLEESFRELIDLKNEHEKSLLEKFSLLLNEKKLKIRDQQRLLSASNVDPAKLAVIEAERSDSRSHSAGPSGLRKRKAGEEGSDDESDAFEKMEVDEDPKANDSENSDRRTPSPESTADEASEDDEPPPPLKKVGRVGAKNDVAKALSSKPAKAEKIKGDDAPPPKRQLPFQQKPTAKPAPEAAPILEGSETESDDEEL
ncbi:hypothetical protein BGZ60DRAFT_384402 [Tricladium varicosporioides]|nr:hypothetical protein BGZ60DRAFT_384402 [Hymenoscyphus varicosporioides]